VFGYGSTKTSATALFTPESLQSTKFSLLLLLSISNLVIGSSIGLAATTGTATFFSVVF